MSTDKPAADTVSEETASEEEVNSDAETEADTDTATGAPPSGPPSAQPDPAPEPEPESQAGKTRAIKNVRSGATITYGDAEAVVVGPTAYNPDLVKVRLPNGEPRYEPSSTKVNVVLDPEDAD